MYRSSWGQGGEKSDAELWVLMMNNEECAIVTKPSQRIYRIVSGPIAQGGFWVRWCKTPQAAQVTADVMDKHAPPVDGMGASIDAIDFQSDVTGIIALLNAIGGNFEASLMEMEPGSPVSISNMRRT